MKSAKQSLYHYGETTKTTKRPKLYHVLLEPVGAVMPSDFGYLFMIIWFVVPAIRRRTLDLSESGWRNRMRVEIDHERQRVILCGERFEAELTWSARRLYWVPSSRMRHSKSNRSRMI